MRLLWPLCPSVRLSVRLCAFFSMFKKCYRKSFSPTMISQVSGPERPIFSSIGPLGDRRRGSFRLILGEIPYK